MPSPTSGRAVAPEDLFRLGILQTARLSPDGRSVVYGVAKVDAEEAEHVTLWLLTLETGATRQLTTGSGRDTNPEWSPDGRQIAFSSTRDGKAQLYVIAVDGGEARAVTTLEQGVGGGPIWSPDGSQLAFTATAAPPPDLSKPYRFARHVYRFDGMGYLDGSVQSLYVVGVHGPLTGSGGTGEPQRLTTDAQNNSALAWSPDGSEILVLSTMRPDSHDSYKGHLRSVTLAGEVRDLIGSWGAASAAAWTPDGQQIVFYGSPNGLPIGSKSDVWVLNRAGGTPECRTTGLKFQSGGDLQDDMALALAPRLLITRDGKSAYTHVQVGGTVQIYRVALAGPEEHAVVIGGERACFPFGLGEQQLLFSACTITSPLDLYLANLASGEERQLTQLNAALLAELAPVSVKPLTFSGSDGVPVEGWLLRPAIGAAPYPTVLYIHGGPHGAFGHTFSFDFHMLAGAGYAVLFVNQRGSTGYGDPFATSIIGDWGNHDYGDLMAGVDAAIAAGLADPDRLGVCGLSGGGNLSCWVVGQTRRFKAAVPENPVTNWVSFYGVSDIGAWFAVEEMGGRPHEIPEVYRRCSPITYAHTCTTPTLLIQGEVDYRCPAEQSEQFYTTLKANGCTVEMLRFPGGSHAASIFGAPIIRKAHNEALLGWMNRYVLGSGD